MLKRERQAFILHQVNLHNKVLSLDLSQQMDVSEDTIRRDLSELATLGKIIKVHGGALSKPFHNFFEHSNIYSLPQKKVIAQKAIQLIRNGMFVFTTGGTTIIELARSLPEGLQATFITGSLPAAFEYMQHPGIDVIIIGDKVSKSSHLTVGAEAITKIKQFNADLCFLGTNAIDVEHGFTDNDWEVAQVKKAMIESSANVVSLTIAEKLNTHLNVQVCDIKKINTLITELPPEDSLFEPYKAKGLRII